MKVWLEVINVKPKRVDIVAHLRPPEPTAHLILEEVNGEMRRSYGRPLNEKGINGVVTKEVFDEAEKEAIAQMKTMSKEQDQEKNQPRLPFP